MTRRVVEPRRMVITFQQAPPRSLTGAAASSAAASEALLKPRAALVDASARSIPAATTEIEIRIPTDWLGQLGWSNERPELRMVLNSEGIHITPLYPRAEEGPRVFALAAGDLQETSEGS